MFDWAALLRRPEVSDEAGVESWFGAVAGRLLNGSRLVVGGVPHRFVEVEFYYCGPDHPDPFTHRDPLQLQCGRWYFHRTRGVYRSGSFKGFDVTFGDGTAFGGVLIRGVEGPGGALTDGPSLCVDHLLDATGAGTVAALDRTVGARVAWDADNPLRLEATEGSEPRTLLRCARVGLSLKRGRVTPEMLRYVLAPYRYLSEPRRTSKGKLQMALALHAQGRPAAAIREATGCPARTVERYAADFEAGRREASFDPYCGIDLKPVDLCRLHGTWHEKWGARPAEEPGGG
jgi:hypothetical protein